MMTQHAPVKDGHEKWSSSRLRQVFRNPALWGDLAYGRSRVITEKRGNNVVVVGRGINPTAVPFKVPPLIHRTEFERSECSQGVGCDRDGYTTGETLDRLIKSNNPRVAARPYTLQHPLRRLVVCPCGWRMGFRQKRWKGVDKEYGYLFCTRTKQRGKSVVGDYPDCPVSGISTRKLWPRVRDQFLDAVRNPDRVLAEIHAQLVMEHDMEPECAVNEAETLEKITSILADLDGQENRLYERWDAGEISRVVYATQTARIVDNRRALQDEKQHLLAQRDAVRQVEKALLSLKARLSEAATLPLNKLSVESCGRSASHPSVRRRAG